MTGGKSRIWLLYRLGVFTFCGFQTFLNYVFKMGQLVDLKTAGMNAEEWLDVLAHLQAGLKGEE